MSSLRGQKRPEGSLQTIAKALGRQSGSGTLDLLIGTQAGSAAGLPADELDRLDVRPHRPLLPPAAAIAAPGFSRLPRQLAEGVADRLEQIDGELFTRWRPGIDLRNSFVYVLALELGMWVLPALHGFLSATDADDARAMLDGPLTAELISDAARRLGHEPGSIANLVDHERDERALAELGERLATGSPSSGGTAAKLGAQRRAAAVIVCGTYPEAERLGELAAVMRSRGGAIVLAKTNTEDCRRAVERVRARGARSVLAAGTLPGLPVGRAEADRLRRGVGELLERLASLEPELRGFAAKHALTLLKRLRLALGWEQLVDRVQPRVVAGTLDRSAWGPITAEFPPRHDYALVEVQHGLNISYGATDLMPFDLVLAFNDHSRRRLIADGYPGDRPIKVVGDPRWDSLQSAAPRRSRAPEIEAWKGEDRLILVLPQPRKGALMSSAGVGALYEWVGSVAADEGLKVLVKRRQGQEPDPEVAALEPLVERGSARFVSSEQAELEPVLALADVAVSIFSSALLEAYAAGVPCVSPDPDGVVERLDLGRAVAACRSREEFGAAVRRALAGPAAGRDPELLPPFGESYSRRVRLALREIGALGGLRPTAVVPHRLLVAIEAARGRGHA